MVGSSEGADSEMSSPSKDDSISRNDHDTSAISHKDEVSIQENASFAEQEELDEFGLPIIKRSRSASTRSASFASARSSIDEEPPLHEMSKTVEEEEDEGAADVEDNDVEEEQEPTSPTSPTEWPRLSRSTLPGAGHVKNSPFHATPPKTKEKDTVYAERAKDLIKVSPVSNSIFKKKDSPVSARSPTSMSFPATARSESRPNTPLKEEPTETIPTKEEPEESTAQPTEETETERNIEISTPQTPPNVTINTDLDNRKFSQVSANVIFESPEEIEHNPAGASQWSHQMGVIQAQSHSPKNRKSLSTPTSPQWEEMPAFGTHDLYDEDGHLVARQFQESDDEDTLKGGAGKGYTRMNQDEDAQSADSMDENTEYLFKETLEDDDAKTPLSQMQATKELLTEEQRIAYVGLCKLTMVSMLRDVGRVRFKENRAAYESMTLWSQKMMIRLFSHMDISSEVMIEQLAEHGIIPADLIPALTINVEVANPLTSLSSPTDASSIVSQQSVLSSSSSTPPSTPSSPPPIQSPSTLTSKKIALDLRWTILCDLFLVLIADSIYDARSRVLLTRMGEHLGVEWIDITRFERRVTEALQVQESGEQNWKDQALLDTRAKQARNRRYMMMGLATLGGGLVIGLSAGLLAPVIGAGLGAAFTTIGITGTTGFLAGTGGAALITTSGITAGGAIAGKGMAKRTRSVRTFEFRPLHNNQRVNLLLTVSGWMSSKEDDVRLPFSTIDPVMGDIIALLWEPEILQSMGQTMNLLATEILTQSLQQVLGQTVLVALMSSIQWPVMLTKLSYLIDNPWSTSLDRASSCGLILADALIHRNLGNRPISLAGYSLGARVIYYCLLELARVKAYGLIQDVFLFGGPIIIKQKECLRAQSIVAGRFVNGYKRNDWILGYLFRATTSQIGRVAGLGPIENCGDIENLDCTEIVGGHLMYREHMPKLMKEAGFLVVSEEFSEMEDPDPDRHRERQIALYDEIEEAKRLVAQEEAEAIKTGKKVKRPSKKSGFLGLWGKEIQEKPVGYNADGHRMMVASPRVGDYDPYEPTGTKSTANGSPEIDKESKNSVAGDDMVLFDVDKMREELAANGITINKLESTLPPLLVPSPAAPLSRSASPIPPVPRITASPVPPPISAPVPAPIQRAYSPSYVPSRPLAPFINRPNRSSSSLSRTSFTKEIREEPELKPRDITPKKELDKLVIDTKKMSVGWNLAPPKSHWDDNPSTTEGGIKMSFEPEPPEAIRPPTNQSFTPQPYIQQSYSTSSQSIAEKKEDTRPLSSVLNIPVEKNVWDDDDYGGESGGNITMTFE